jgi:hypothetical protein
VDDHAAATAAVAVGRPRKNICGKVFGRLTALRSTDEQTRHGYVWVCQCACGAEHKAAIGHLTAGSVTSCGCSRRKA